MIRMIATRKNASEKEFTRLYDRVISSVATQVDVGFTQIM